MPYLDEVERHGHAHDTGADEADVSGRGGGGGGGHVDGGVGGAERAGGADTSEARVPKLPRVCVSETKNGDIKFQAVGSCGPVVHNTAGWSPGKKLQGATSPD